MLGPRVMAGLTCRITMPGEEHQETHWHFHQRINMEPAPPFHAPHNKVDCLVYLDELDDVSGTLCVVPGSHCWDQRYLPADQYGEMDGQVEIKGPAGTAVLMHTNLWHRGTSNTAQGHRRRLLLLGYTGITMDHIRRSRLPKGGAIEAALAKGDPELDEIVGAASGYSEWSGNLP
jgi:ectoine hydroxylase-related dioxygenase (phytanoyl-CoA dioxygenase family)